MAFCGHSSTQTPHPSQLNDLSSSNIGRAIPSFTKITAFSLVNSPFFRNWLKLIGHETTHTLQPVQRLWLIFILYIRIFYFPSLIGFGPNSLNSCTNSSTISVSSAPSLAETYVYFTRLGLIPNCFKYK